jgi:chromate transporter
LAFVLPSFVMVVILGWLYRLYGGLDWMQAVFYGIAAAVIGIIALSAYKLTLKTIGKKKLLWVIYLISAAATALTESEFFLIIVLGGVVVWLVENPPFKKNTLNAMGFLVLPIAVESAQVAPSGDLLWKMLGFFAKAGALVFGSGLAIIPALHGGVVKEYHWLTEQQFLDAVAVAMITPGPVVITVGFIGYLVAGFPGACMAAIGTFLPCYLFTIIPALYFKKHGKRPAILSFVDGVTAAAVGAITGAVIVLGRRSITDVSTILIALATGLILWKTKKIPEPVLILFAAVIGFLLKGG